MNIAFTFGRFNIYTHGGHGRLINTVQEAGTAHHVIGVSQSTRNAIDPEIRLNALEAAHPEANIELAQNPFAMYEALLEQYGSDYTYVFITSTDNAGLARGLQSRYGIEIQILDRDETAPSSTMYRQIFDQFGNSIEGFTAALNANLCSSMEQFLASFNCYSQEIA
jgi:hypothetical protein